MSLREIEEYGAKAAHVAPEQVRNALHGGGDDRSKVISRHESTDVTLSSRRADRERTNEASSKAKVRTGIVSVNGRDVDRMHCTGGRRNS